MKSGGVDLGTPDASFFSKQQQPPQGVTPPSKTDNTLSTGNRHVTELNRLNRRKNNNKFIAIAVLIIIAIVGVGFFFMKDNKQEIYNNAKKAVVIIKIYDYYGKESGLGSGFFIDENHVITNYHVIRDAAGMKITDFDGKTINTLHVVGFDEDNDLAVIKTSTSSSYHLPIREINDIAIGEDIYVIGHPRGFEYSITDGLVSSVRTDGVGSFTSLIQISAPVSGGNSGGPVIDSKGRAIGITTLASNSPELQNINFAVPITSRNNMQGNGYYFLNQRGNWEVYDNVKNSLGSFYQWDIELSLNRDSLSNAGNVTTFWTKTVTAGLHDGKVDTAYFLLEYNCEANELKFVSIPQPSWGLYL